MSNDNVFALKNPGVADEVRDALTEVPVHLEMLGHLGQRLVASNLRQRDPRLELPSVIPSLPSCNFPLRPCGRYRRPSGQRLHLSGCLNLWDPL